MRYRSSRVSRTATVMRALRAILATGQFSLPGLACPWGTEPKQPSSTLRPPAIVGPARLSNSGRAPWTSPKDEPSSNPHYPRIRGSPAGSDRNPRIRLSIVCNSYCADKPLRGRPKLLVEVAEDYAIAASNALQATGPRQPIGPNDAPQPGRVRNDKYFLDAAAG